MAVSNGVPDAAAMQQELTRSLATNSNSYAQALKAYDTLIKHADGSESVQLFSNRAFCYEKLQLNRKALKDYEAALQKDPSNLQVLLRQGKVLHALKRTQEAKQLWERAAGADLLSSDLALVLEAQALLKNPDGNSQPAPAAAPAALSATPTVPTPARPASPPAPALPASGEPTASSATKLQAALHALWNHPAHPTSNGAAVPKAAAAKSRAKAKAKYQLSPDMLLMIEKDPNQAVGVAVNQINEGKVVEAEGLLCRILEKAPPHAKLGAYVARGTARALSRDLQPAVDDFSKAIALEPRYADCWKRRGQARAALGENEAALQDLRKAADLTADRVGKADCQMECGMILQKQKDYCAATTAFEAATRLDPRNVAATNMLGLCYVSQGDLRDGIKAYEKALRLDPGLQDAWSNLATAHKEIGHVKEAEQAFARSIKLRGDRDSAVSMRMVAELRRGCGDHMSAINILDRALAAAPAHHRIELLFLRGACYHALGYYRSAARDYGQAFSTEQADSSNEVKMQQFLAFYQRELALYVYHNLDRPLTTYFLDKDISPVFKESWCKKGPPPPQLLSTAALQLPFPAAEPTPPPVPKAEKVAKLVKEADAIGDSLRYGHQGFLANKRQLRMGGLAAIELAQLLRSALKHQRANLQLRVSNDGASGERSASGSHPLGWRDAMDVLVRWRQLSEPNDQVLWVDLLTKQEFEAGFGSHTPIFSGQTKCVRYYMNFERALGIFKEVLLRDGHGFDAHNIAVPIDTDAKRKAVAAAQTAEELWKAVGGVDCWAVVPIAAVHRAGHDLEGTRLTVVRLGDMPNGYEVSIRTPVTPPRWEDFDEELTACWGALMDALASGDRPEIACRTLHYAYYWYNFMPLARGSAVVGAMTILAVFLAAGMPVTASIPPGYQTDWEAILSQSVEPFICSVLPWLYPPEARGDAAEDTRPFAPLEELPAVKDLLGTMRARLEALNGPDLPRLHTDRGR